MALKPITNPPSNLSLNEMRAVIGRDGSLAKAARFAVRFLPEGTDNRLIGAGAIMNELTYMCESAELPSRGFVNADIRYYGPNFKVPFQTNYDDITMVFLCRSKFSEREFFDAWQAIINPISSFDFTYMDEYTCKIELFQLAEFAEYDDNTEGLSPGEGGGTNAPTPVTAPKAIYKYTLHEAWPLMISPQPVVWSDDNFQRVAVTFTFKKWSNQNDELPRSNLYDVVEDRTNAGPGTNTLFPNPPRF